MYTYIYIYMYAHITYAQTHMCKTRFCSGIRYIMADQDAGSWCLKLCSDGIVWTMEDKCRLFCMGVFLGGYSAKYILHSVGITCRITWSTQNHLEYPKSLGVPKITWRSQIWIQTPCEAFFVNDDDCDSASVEPERVWPRGSFQNCSSPCCAEPTYQEGL